VEGAEQLKRVVCSATVTIQSGKEDHLLRRLAIEIELGVEGSPAGETLDALGTTIEFSLTLDDPNEPVTVPAPEDPLPYTELPVSG
jgi:hypothetical protein